MARRGFERTGAARVAVALTTAALGAGAAACGEPVVAGQTRGDRDAANGIDATSDAERDASVVPETDVAIVVDAAGNAACVPCGRPCTADEACTTAGCIPKASTAPRPSWPPVSSRVANGSPTFRWVLPDGADGARVEVCADLACTAVRASGDVTGTTWTPAGVLPVGLAFWRVTARRGAAIAGAPSAARSFVVRAGAASYPGVSSRRTDFDGDGPADYVTATNDSRGLAVFRGGPGAPHAAPDMLLAFADLPESQEVLATAVGDLDGNGVSEVVLRRRPTADPGVRLSTAVRYGRRDGAASEPVAFVPSAFGLVEPLALVGAGDVDRDGYDDLIALEPSTASTPAHFRILLGTPAGPWPSARVIEPPPGVDFTHAVLGSSVDTDGDGRPDVLAVVNDVASVPGRVYAVTVDATCGGGSAVRLLLEGTEPGDQFGDGLVVADFNGDGRNDLGLRDPVARRGEIGAGMLVYLATPHGFDTVPTQHIQLEGPALEPARNALAGDIDGDGFDDGVFWIHSMSDGPMLHVRRGSPAGLSASDLQSTGSRDLGSSGTALSLLWLGDLDADGREDLVAGLGAGELVLVRGGASGLVPRPAFPLNRP